MSAAAAWAAYEAAGRPPACPRCGQWKPGAWLPSCTVAGQEHADTCAQTRWAPDVCKTCVAAMAADV